jgi:hypothetical protein
MARLDWPTGPKPEWRLRDDPERIESDDIARAARELVAAYGPRAGELMRQRMRAVRRRGDRESASLWFAVARAIEAQTGASVPKGADGGPAD